MVLAPIRRKSFWERWLRRVPSKCYLRCGCGDMVRGSSEKCVPDTPLFDELSKSATSRLRLTRTGSSSPEGLDSPMVVRAQSAACQRSIQGAWTSYSPARLRRGPGVSPMGSAPHGRHTGVTPRPNRCLTGPPGRDGESFDGCNSRGRSDIHGWIKLRFRKPSANPRRVSAG